jgi:hypothetical protein
VTPNRGRVARDCREHAEAGAWLVKVGLNPTADAGRAEALLAPVLACSV